ncbi:protein S100-A11-like [Diceros bicornis minor]|uniref:S100/CaBP-9k-type calcium binding subdomain domain-containing protein n=1 Tax=Diceros bicornis minor TaxID=77932 RepID=A0A7J7FB21_DICBM|nr:protein S100-A11-like [Diceros bicornis minor]KAF5924906.1 hypothetical protein HPG69_008580 [Diceros bicornis minor]
MAMGENGHPEERKDASHAHHSLRFNTNKAKISSPIETEWRIKSLIAVFQKYAGKDGNNCRLSKSRFLSFMKTELAAITKSQKDPSALDHMMQKQDLSYDGQLDFQDVLNLLGSMAVACHDSFNVATHSQKQI